MLHVEVVVMPQLRSGNRRRVDVREVKARRRGRWVRLGSGLFKLTAVAALLLGLGFGARLAHDWALASPTFALEHIGSSGLVRAKESELLKLAGVSPGQNLFALDLEAVEKSLATHPWVKSAIVHRRFPRGLELRVTEHEPAALAGLGDVYLVDSNGEPFKKVEPQDNIDLPLISGVDRDHYVADPEDALRTFRRALEIARAYKATDLEKRAPLSEIRMGQDGPVLVTGRDGEEVRLGDEHAGTGELDGQWARLATIRGELHKRGLTAQVIHLDNRVRPSWVAVKVDGAADVQLNPLNQ